MRAERRAGELLIEMAERKERHSGAVIRAPWGRGLLPHERSQSSPISASTRRSPPAGRDSPRWTRTSSRSRSQRASKSAYDRIAQRFVKEAEIERAQQRHAKLIEHGCMVDDLVALAASGKRFSTILADPAWPWDTGQLGSRHVAQRSPLSD